MLGIEVSSGSKVYEKLERHPETVFVLSAAEHVRYTCKYIIPLNEKQSNSASINVALP